MKKLAFILALAPFLLLNSCGSDEPEDYSYGFEDDYEVPQEEEPELTSITFDDLKKFNVENRSLITIEAYVGRLPEFLFGYDDKDIRLDFFSRRNQCEGFGLGAYFTVGGAKNEVRSIPEDFDQSDLNIMSNDAETIGVGDYVRLEGRFVFSDYDSSFYLNSEKIELLEKPAFDKSVFDQAVELTDEVIENESEKKTYSYMDVKMSLSSYMMVFSGNYAVDIKQNNNSKIKDAHCRIGEGPGKMKELVDNFTNADFIVYDVDGNEQKGASGKYRLYGTFFPLNTSSVGMFKVEEFVKL